MVSGVVEVESRRQLRCVETEKRRSELRRLLNHRKI